MLERRTDRRDQLAQTVPSGDCAHRANHPRAVTAALLIGRDRRQERRQGRRRRPARSPAHTALERTVDARRKIAHATAPAQRDREAGGDHGSARVTEHGLELGELPVERPPVASAYRVVVDVLHLGRPE